MWLTFWWGTPALAQDEDASKAEVAWVEGRDRETERHARALCRALEDEDGCVAVLERATAEFRSGGAIEMLQNEVSTTLSFGPDTPGRRRAAAALVPEPTR